MPQTEQQELIARAAERERHDLGYPPSRPFDFFLWLEHDGLDAYVAELAQEITARETRRKRDDTTQAKFIFSIKLILLNLLAAHKAKLDTLQAIPLRIGEFSINTRYDQKHTAYNPFIHAKDGLLDLGLIHVVTKGFYDHERGKGQRTRIDATNALKAKFNTLFPQEVVYFTRHPDEENIILKDENKKLLEYADTAYTLKARDNLKIINACLNRHWYDLRLSEEEFTALHDEMMKRHKIEPKKPAIIQFHERSLYRIYNNGDTPEGENFQQNGRFYGGWWEGILSDYRTKIMIDGKPTVEIDYSGYHPRMLYALEGLDLGDNDPYLPEGLGKEWRDFGKEAFTKLLNGKNSLSKPKEYDESAVGIKWKALLALMEKHHAPISEHFRTGYGLDLMRKDADIAERIMLHFAKRDIPCLPVHDSFIVHHAHTDELQDLMIREYKKVFEQDINTKLDDGFKLMISEQTRQSDYDIEDILRQEQESQYHRRLNQWWEHTSAL